MLGSLIGATLITAFLYQILRLLLLRFISIERNSIIISSILAGIIAETIWFGLNGYISFYYTIGAIIVFLIASSMYSSKVKKNRNKGNMGGKENITSDEAAKKLFTLALGDSRKVFDDLKNKNIIRYKIEELTQNQRDVISLKIMTLFLGGYLFIIEQNSSKRMFESMKQDIFWHISNFSSEVNDIQLRNYMESQTILHFNCLKNENYYHVNMFIDSLPFEVTDEELTSLSVFWDKQFSQCLSYWNLIENKFNVTA